MSGASGTNNSWTILTSEETVAETLRPSAAGAEQHDLSQTPAPGSGGNHQPDQGSGGNHQPDQGSGGNHQPDQGAASAEGLPVEDGLASEDKRTDSGSDQHSSVPHSLNVSSMWDHGDGVGPAEGPTKNPTQSSPDPESSSESYTLLPPSPPGGAELTGEKLTKVEDLHPQNEEIQQKGEESEHHPQTDETTEKTGAKGDLEERRKKSLLAVVEQIGQREEEEEFHLPQQENSSIFSLNKCILGAVILLGFGTIFFSENDHAAMELKDAESPGKREWFNPDADASELLNKLAEGSQQISALQAQLQAQKEELKVVKEQAAEGEKERLLWEEVEKENSRLKTEMASLPVLQKENDRMKEELESVPALQKELETLRSTVTKFKLPSGDLSSSTVPPTGQPEDSSQVTAPPTDGQTRKTRDDRKEEKESKLGKREAKEEKKQSKERERSVRKKGEQKEDKHSDEKEWKKGKHGGGTFDEEKAGKQKRHSDERKEGKKERGEDRKPWKDKEGKKGKLGKVNEGWRGKEEKREHQEGMYHSERHKGREEWKGEMEWTKRKDGMKEGGGEKWERKDWKEKGEKKEWKKEKKDHHKEERGRSERKQWEDGRSYDGGRTGKEERKSRNERQDEERKKRDEDLRRWEKEEWKRGGEKERRHSGDKSHSSQKREEHLYGERKPPHSHPRPSVGQPEYWLQRRDRLRLRRRPTPPQHCHSPESCAQAERLLPVGLLEFQNLLQPYLTKAEEVGVDGSRTDELRKLAAEFFTDGMFVHDQMSFRDFMEELGDVLEDLVEGDEEEDSDVEDEMEQFEKEVLKTFLVPGGKEKERRMKGEWREESREERG